MAFHDSILIPGGRGMLAQALQRELNLRGHSYAAPDRAELDVTDDASVARAFKLHRPTAVLNCSAYTKVDLAEEHEAEAHRVNGQAVETLARHCAATGATLVHFSTDFVFDGSLRRPYRPDDPTNPVSAYGRSKLLGERAIRATPNLRFLLVRTSWLYGPGGVSFPQTMVTLAKQGVPLRVVADQAGSPTFTHDLAAATLDLLDRGASGVWHLTNAGETTWYGFAKAALEEFGVVSEVTPITSADWKRARPASATRPPYSVLDVTPFEHLVGRPMRPWRDALRSYRDIVLGRVADC
jgi:dTDP-4-dehydrorhamnose reductase